MAKTNTQYKLCILDQFLQRRMQPRSAPTTENGSNFQTATLLTICRLNLFPALQIIVLYSLWPGPCLQVVTLTKTMKMAKTNTHVTIQIDKDKENCEYSKSTSNNFLLQRLLFSVAAEPLSVWHPVLIPRGAPTTLQLLNVDP